MTDRRGRSAGPSPADRADAPRPKGGSTAFGFRLGLRLAAAGGSESRFRLAVTALGVGIGVTLFLLALTAQSAVEGRAERSGWLSATGDTADDPQAGDPAVFLAVTDYHQGRPMTRAHVAAMGPDAPVPPGLDRLPGPGEVAVSPALRRLLDTLPDDRMADRFPGRVVATIGDEGLAHPEAIVGLVGRTEAQMAAVHSSGKHVVRGFDERPSGYAFYLGARLFLGVGALLLLVPVVVFIVTATRVAAAQRDQRLAAVRIAGATRPQLAAMAAAETGVAAVLGTALGWVGYEVGRRVLAARVDFQGGRFFLADVAVGPRAMAPVLVGMPVLAVVAAIVSLRGGGDGLLAAARRVPGRRPSAWRLVPFGAGVGGLLVGAAFRDALGPELVDRASPPLVIATLVGFVLLGPWLCLLAGEVLARVSRRVPGLIAARRLAGDPHATFRTVGGVVLATFVVTWSASAVEPAELGPRAGSGDDGLRAGVVEVRTPGVPDTQVESLLGGDAVATRLGVRGRFDTPGEMVASCRDLARVREVACGGPGEPLPGGIRELPGVDGRSREVVRVYVPTDGTAAAMERVRTRAAVLVPNAIIHTPGDRLDADGRLLGGLGRLQQIGWLFVLVVAACSLTVGMLAGLIERRRPLALLRASGLAAAELRRVVLLETAAAMLLTAAIGVGLGLLSSWSFALFQQARWQWPDGGVFAMVGVGVLAALVLAALSLPLIEATTRPSRIRYE